MSEAMNFLAGSPLDRREALRDDPEAMARLLAAGAHRVVPVSGSKLAVEGEAPVRAVFLEGAAAERVLRGWPSIAFLGEDEGTRYWMIDLDAGALPEDVQIPGRIAGLRDVGALLEPKQGAILAQARALAAFHRHHVHCGRCGADTEPIELGYARRCRAASCGATVFPRSDPAMIVLLHQGDRCLLIRQPEWPAGVYATVAGFVEPGESLEDTVRREVKAETDLDVVRLDYHSSQPWPFPSSIMIGFTAEVRGEVQPNPRELEDARWFTAAGLQAATRRGDIVLPPHVSISRSLIEGWVERQRESHDA